MSTHWHPLFAALLGTLLKDHYEIQTEVPVSDLPRRGDFLIIRRQDASPPFVGLWSHLTDWNVLEFKGPTDAPEEDDLEKLVHVGTGITYRLNEERRTRGEEKLANRQVAFWYLAPKLGETFIGQALSRAALTYEGGGLWRGVVWGHPLWFVSYRDAPVEADSVPLHVLDPETPAPRELGELLVKEETLLRRFASWLAPFNPRVWKEIQLMASTGIINWEEVGKVTNLDDVVRVLPPERVIEILGPEQAAKLIGIDAVIAAVGMPRVIEQVGVARFIETYGEKKLLAELVARMPREEVQEILKQGDEGLKK